MKGGLRIETGVKRGAPARFRFDGRVIDAFEGETVAAALLAAGVRNLRGGDPRGMLCAMGVCQECVVVVDGRRTESCRLAVRDGLTIERLP